MYDELLHDFLCLPSYNMVKDEMGGLEEKYVSGFGGET
jgi:hypothetical protein